MPLIRSTTTAALRIEPEPIMVWSNSVCVTVKGPDQPMFKLGVLRRTKFWLPVWRDKQADQCGRKDQLERPLRKGSLLAVLLTCTIVGFAGCSSEAPEMAAPDETNAAADAEAPASGGSSDRNTYADQQAAPKNAEQRYERKYNYSPPQPSQTAKPPSAAGGNTATGVPAGNAGATRGLGASTEKDLGAVREAAPGPSISELVEESRPEAAAAEAVAEENSDWELVPVFYGTDRTRADNKDRLDYDGTRGRRLELGQAIVSVPKVHQVPNIERPWALRIPYFDVTIYEEDEDPKKHFVMQNIKAVSREDFLNLVRARLATSSTFKDQAFIFIHGFNTTFENGVYRTAQIAHDLKFDGAPFLYSWPSGGGVASYTYDRESSGQSTPYMRDFVKLVLNDTGAKAVSVIAHSMGNQPILQVLRDLKRSTPDDVIISQVILAAPDVDRDNFENIAKEILGLAKGVTLYVASNDQALQYSRRFHGGVARAGDVPEEGPVTIDGIDTIDITAASTDSLGYNHSGYAENNALLKDIGKLIQTGLPPAERHPPQYERVEQGTHSYWRYPAN